ncbi:aldehyde dehydrogenase, putative [Perkinsus marinus ATCC 50983]|uniref:Aldehyde dehydrogenase, putative n=1 Tax=Perkinsus marinus (strain ATCC 50983 / TXsc) TaxID=423536 RepID=C5LK18_PERM5|nr:aldehyde dehydrogenase, putative [Perkinsus marinus ATCC 50983]EER02907.1 aldehyde dehydrogenase, putative [Perkinsus marinus ATCC 50983]|eukprot:XP_002771091.1 aldehyde dehydrogenase, putative [Perkinsus marinus ATCC 50983]
MNMKTFAVSIRIQQLTGPHLKKLSLELGGKNATIVWRDAPIESERMMTSVVRSAFANSGQICLCGSRLLVHEEIYDRFTSAFVSEAAKLRIGDPLEPTTTTGPLISREHAWRVHNFVLWSLQANPGARVLLGGPDAYDGKLK